LCLGKNDIDSESEELKLLKSQNKLLGLVAKEIATQHRIRLDIWSSNTRSKFEQADFKSSLIINYQRSSTLGDTHLKCMILDVDIPRPKVIASHIWKFHTEGEGLEEFGLQVTDLGNVRNGLLLCESIEQAFDSKRVCFLIDRIHPEDIVLKVLDPNLFPMVVSSDSPTHPQETFQDIDGRLLQHPPGILPFRRILNFHAKLSFQKAIRKGWIANDISFEDFFDLSIDGSIPDLNMYDDFFND